MTDASPIDQRTAPGNETLRNLLRDRITGDGPITFAMYMEAALYHPDHGYYRQPGRKPGRGGDFMTSPELHPFFGMTLARQIADAWDRLGQPERLVVREHGASSGGLAYDIMVALSDKAPDVLDALDYRLIDVNPHRLQESLAAMGEVGFADRVSVEDPGAQEPEVGVVLANELVDALPVHRLIVRNGELLERYVGWEHDRFVDHDAGLSDAVIDAGIVPYLAEAGIDVDSLPDGAELDVCPAAAGWISQVAASLERGFVFVIDYGYEAATLYSGHRLDGLVRGYAAHTVTDDPYLLVGEQDLTAHIDFTWLKRAGERADLEEIGLITQSEFLINLRLGDWLVELQQQPDVDVAEYYRAQAATMRLIDPAGLGRFRVLGMAKGVETAHEAAGFRDVTFADELGRL